MFTKVKDLRVNLKTVFGYMPKNVSYSNKKRYHINFYTSGDRCMYVEFDTEKERDAEIARLDKLIQNAGLYPYRFKP